MTIHKRVVAGQSVTINALPWPEFEEKWDRWRMHALDNEGGIIGFDVETTEIDEVLGPFEPTGKLRTVQFGSRRYAWVLDAHDEFWRPRITKMLHDPRFRFVSHTNYDVLWSGREFGVPADDRFIDTIVMAGLVYPGVTRPKDLKSLSSELIDSQLEEAEQILLAHFKELAPTGQRAGKKAPKAWGFTNIELTDELFQVYAGLDSIYVRRLLDILNEKLKRRRQSAISKREQRIARLATQMRQRGQRVDPEWVDRMIGEVEGEYESAAERLSELWGKPTSPKRGDWLLDHGAQFYEVTETGLPKLTMPSAASEGTLLELRDRYEEHPVLGPVFADIVTHSSHKNFLTNLKIIRRSAQNDGFVHPEIKTQAAHTGRMSIIKPAMQTLKKRDPRLRGCFIARPGKILVTADYDSQEIRIAAAYSRDPALLRIVREGLNQHVETMKMIFGVSDREAVMNLTTGKTFYDASKTLDFAQQYGAGAARIGDQLGYPSHIDPETGRRYAHPKAYAMWQAWRDAYAGLVEWSAMLAEKQQIINPWGRIIPADRWGRGYANSNYAIQSTGRDALGDAIVALADLGWADALWLFVHDELILEVNEDEAQHAVAALEEAMYCKIQDVELTATAKILGTRWGVAE
jgi:DNA polymerase-1